MSKLLSWLEVFLSSPKVLGNISSFDNSEGFDNLVEMEEFLSKEFHSFLKLFFIGGHTEAPPQYVG